MVITLLDIDSGKEATIVSLKGGMEFQRKIHGLNIREGKRVKKIVSQPLEGPIILEIDGRKVALGRGMAEKIIVDDIV